MNLVKKVISMASAAAVACTMATAAGVSAFNEVSYGIIKFKGVI